MCWRIDERSLRHRTQATSTVFVVVALILIGAAYYKMDKIKYGKSESEGSKAEQGGGKAEQRGGNAEQEGGKAEPEKPGVSNDAFSSQTSV